MREIRYKNWVRVNEGFHKNKTGQVIGINEFIKAAGFDEYYIVKFGSFGEEYFSSEQLSIIKPKLLDYIRFNQLNFLMLMVGFIIISFIIIGMLAGGIQ